jgi:hypothetical protein
MGTIQLTSSGPQWMTFVERLPSHSYCTRVRTALRVAVLRAQSIGARPRDWGSRVSLERTNRRPAI